MAKKYKLEFYLYNSYQINYATIKKRRHPARSIWLIRSIRNKLERRDFLAKLSLYAVGNSYRRFIIKFYFA
jgi:hypothetical protein